MRTVDVATLTQNIKEMCIEANHFLSEDMKTAFTKAEQQEKAPLGKQILQQLQQNMDIAGKDMIPICQDTGMAVVFLEVGQDVHFEGGSVEDAIKYTGFDRQELNMVFTFEHMDVDSDNGLKWTDKKPDLVELKRVFSKWQTGLNGVGWNSLYLNNHDQPRMVSRFGDDGKYWKESAKMLAVCLHMMQGTPYVYQGEEIGMKNMVFHNIEECNDIEAINAYKEYTSDGRIAPEDMMRYINRKGRDNARTPMQWNSDVYAGFSMAKPWYRVNRNYVDINVEKALADKNSIFYCYQKLIKMRKENPIMIYGEYDLLLAEDKNIFAYTRKYEDKTWLIICNFYDKEVDFNLEGTGKILISNYEDTIIDLTKGHLRPYEAVIYQWQK